MNLRWRFSFLFFFFFLLKIFETSRIFERAVMVFESIVDYSKLCFFRQVSIMFRENSDIS